MSDYKATLNLPDTAFAMRANLAQREPERMAHMRQLWLDWNETIPPIPPDATVSLGYSTKDMPQR